MSGQAEATAPPVSYLPWTGGSVLVSRKAIDRLGLSAVLAGDTTPSPLFGLHQSNGRASGKTPDSPTPICLYCATIHERDSSYCSPKCAALAQHQKWTGTSVPRRSLFRPLDWPHRSVKKVKCFSYFILDPSSGFIKIGKAVNPRKRLADLQTSHHAVLVLLAQTTEKEAILHMRFWKLRERGEWFRPGAELVQYLRHDLGVHRRFRPIVDDRTAPTL